MRRGLYALLRAAADRCDPTADLGAQRNVEAKVFTPRALGPPPPPLSYLFLGLCQIGRLSEVGPELGCRVEHALYDSAAHTEPPALDPARYDAVVVTLTLRTLLAEACGADSDLAFGRPDWTVARAAQALADTTALIRDRLERLQGGLGGLPVLVFSFLEPSFEYLGRLQPAADVSQPTVFVRQLNQALVQLVGGYPDLHVYDINEAFNAVGRLHLQDDVVTGFTHSCIIGTFDDELDADRLAPGESNHRVYDVGIALPLLQSYVFRTLGEAVQVLRREDPIKLIIVDLDDTLWRGVAADTEMAAWARTEGWPLGFAEALLYFKRRGGLLAICSKNDHASTSARFAAIWGERLRLDDFVAVRIDWRSKAEGVSEILAEVNLLPEHALFIDDNPRELAEVRAAIPALRCLGGNHRDWRRIVLRAPQTQVPVISEESARRTELVRASAERRAAAAAPDRAAWLVSLELQARLDLVERADGALFERAFELLNKTNQFNTTGRRWSRAEIAAHLAGGGRCLVANLRDATLDNGLIGVALVRRSEVVQVVLSCRVFGLGAEIALGAVATALALQGADVAIGRIVDTGRNLSSRDLYTRLGFATVEDRFEATRAPEPPDWIGLDLSRALRARLGAAPVRALS